MSKKELSEMEEEMDRLKEEEEKETGFEFSKEKVEVGGYSDDELDYMK